MYTFFLIPDHPRALPNPRAVAGRALTILLWVVAITYTAGRLTRRFYEFARPGIAQTLVALAQRLDHRLGWWRVDSPAGVSSIAAPPMKPPTKPRPAPTPAPGKRGPGRPRKVQSPEQL